MGLLLLLITFVFYSSSCNSTPMDNSNTDAQTLPPIPSPAFTDSSSSDATLAAAQSDMWRVELLSAETAESLTATIAAVQYGGDVLETTNEIKPGIGYLFLLLELTIEKIGTGRASFSWSEAHIVDRDGNVYYRHPNDTFLSGLNIPRIRGTDIVFGYEYGYVCFEIPKSAEELKFIADNGDIVIDLS